MLHRAHFNKKVFWTAMCPDCNCSIDLYKRPEEYQFVKCESCGKIHNFGRTILRLIDEDHS